MPLNSETPFIGQKAVEEMAGTTGPNVLRAVAQPPRPEPDELNGVSVQPMDSAAAVVAPPKVDTVAEPANEAE